MHKSNGATKVFPETAIPKLPKTLPKVGIFYKNKIANKRENQSAANVVADVQNTGNSTKQRFLLLSNVQISKLFKT